MKLIKLTILSLTIISLITSCSKDEPVDCGEMAEFNVDKEYCEKMGLPEVEFSVKYPKEFKSDPPVEGEKNYHYNYFLKWDKNEIQTEAITLGYSTLQRNSLMKDELVNQLLPQIKQMYTQAGFELSDEFMGKDKFDGKDYYQFRANGKINDKEIELVGNYKILCLFVEPNVDDKNGLMIMMLANQDSQIKEFNDFSSKGCISSIWKSLKFNY